MDKMEKRSAKATRQHYKKERRDTVVQVRMNEEELERLDAKRGSHSRSNFLRGALYSKSMKSETAMVEIPRLDDAVMELNRIGVNINQIARVLNTQLAKRRVNSVSQLMEYRNLKNDIEELEGCKEEVEKLRASIEELRYAIQEQHAPDIDSDLYFDDFYFEEVMSDVND